MAAFEQKPNTGALFANNEKKGERSPDFMGNVFLDKTFLIEQAHKSEGPLVKIAVSAWKSQSKNGLKYLSLIASEPWSGETTTQPKSKSNPWD